MCGIWCVFGVANDLSYHLRCASTIAHRGPDGFRMEAISGFEDSYLAFFRLAIVGGASGMQPLHVTSLPGITLIYNGEIYNHESVASDYGFMCETGSDGEAILHLYAKFGIERTCKLLDGVFAFVLVDRAKGEVHFGRDTFGVRPLFLLRSAVGGTTRDKSGDGGRCFAACSEMKGLIQIRKDLKRQGACVTTSIDHLQPGHYCTLTLQPSGLATVTRLASYTSITLPPAFETRVDCGLNVRQNVRNLLTEAVRKRLMGSRRVGCLLSGGLDSSLITALTVKLLRQQGYEHAIQTFCVGMEGSDDIQAARKVAEYLGTEHHEVFFKADKAIKEIPTVIKHLEGYDNSTIRGSICLFLVCKYIRERTETVVLLSGEGADELAQGYEYFQHAPSDEHADEESRRLLRDIYMYDVLRVDRCTAAHGLELRVPILDKAFTSYYLSLPPEIRRPHKGMEKYLLRASFQDDHLIPDEILWRKKAAMPDGVSAPRAGVTWLETLHRHFSNTVADNEMTSAMTQYPFNTPTSKQALFYRKTFEDHFPGQYHVTPRMWSLKWVECEDPSAWVYEQQSKDNEQTVA